jgi:uncharacterized protein (DUF1778 family)
MPYTYQLVERMPTFVAERTRTERLEARITREAKELCLKAATLQGTTLTDFVVSSALEAAKRTVREHEVVELTLRDRIAFVEAILNPPVPNARLKKAAKRYAQTFSGNR